MRSGRPKLLGLSGIALLLLLVPAGRSLRAQGTITGKVTAENSSQPLAGANVLVIGTSASAVVGEDGKYTLRNVRVGAVEVQVLHVGYKSLKKIVTVTSGGTAQADFVLAQAIVQLDEIVTTATGQQRRIELGNAVATLGDVNKRVENSAVTNLSDLLVAKTPGVILLPSPVVGGAPTIRVRGISSINLSNAPIWVVDGVRYSTNNTSNAGQTPSSLLNNLSPEEIEDIEIVKGPSAATLYGTNAANGVILITTKKGRSGTTKWNFTGESRTISDRNHYQPQYANFGHTPATPQNNIRCLLPVMQTTAFSIAQGATCIADSLTSYDYLADPEITFIHLGRGSLYGASVNGGSEAVRFFASANLDNEFGPIQMPENNIRYFNDVMHVPVTNSMLHPRNAQRLNLRANLSASLSPKMDLTASAGFGKSSNSIEPDNSLIIGLLYIGQAGYGWKGCPVGTETTGCGMTGSDAKGYKSSATGFPLYEANAFAPGEIMQYVTTNDVQRFTGSFAVNWRPMTWLANDGTVGVDLANNDVFHVCRLNECPGQGATSRVGNVSDFKENRRNFSTKVSSTATWQANTWANVKTSVGAEYANVENDNLSASGRTLAPGASTLGAAATFVSFGATQPTAVKTLGYYAQEQLGVRDRMFLTIAARQDQNSAFGTKFQHVLYPKVSLSWIISDENFFPKFDWLGSLRVRSAYGANGVQPQATAALQTFSTATQTVTKVDATTGTDIAGLTANNPGNSALKPEKSAELETGFETDLFNRRIHLDYTFYKKNTSDALIALPIPSSVAAPVTSLQQNLGKTQNWGHEISASAVILDRRSFAWDVTVSGSHNNNKWVNLGKDPSKCAVPAAGGEPVCQDLVIGAGTTTQQRKGDPLFAQWYRGFTYSDANGDGVIQVAEVAVDSALHFAGVGFAKDLFSVQSGFDLFNRKFRLNMLFDYKGGGNTLEGNYFQCSAVPKGCRENNDQSSPLFLQARAVAINYGTRVGGTNYTTRIGYFSPAQFWKFREMSGVITIPQRVTKWVNAQNGSTLVVGIRNIHTWTKFTGVDPEQNYGVGGTEIANDFNTSPPPTYLTFRLNLKY